VANDEEILYLVNACRDAFRREKVRANTEVRYIIEAFSKFPSPMPEGITTNKKLA
jgi:hypothetical protein